MVERNWNERMTEGNKEVGSRDSLSEGVRFKTEEIINSKRNPLLRKGQQL